MAAPIPTPYSPEAAMRWAAGGDRDPLWPLGIGFLLALILHVGAGASTSTMKAQTREERLETVGQTRERRPWTGSIEKLRKLDAAFAKRHPAGGGLLAMLLDKLH